MGTGLFIDLPRPQLHFLERRLVSSLKKFWYLVRHAIVGVFEAIAFVLMIGTAAVVQTSMGTILILFGLFVGVMGLVIYDVWRV